MRKFLFAVILFLTIIFIIGRIAEVESILNTLSTGKGRFLFLAILIELLLLIIIAATYKAIFRAMGVEETLGRLVLMAVAANFVNIVAPVAGIGGMAIFINETRQSGISLGRGTVASVLYILYDYAGFLSVLMVGLIVLFRRNNITAAEISASIILLLIAISLAIILFLGTRSPKKLGDTLAWAARFVNKLVKPFIRHNFLQERRAYEFAQEASNGLQELRQTPKHLLLPIYWALGHKALLITILFLVFLAFDAPYSFGTLIAAFSIAHLFVIVSPTPSGIGIVEGVLTLVLRSFYLPLGTAAVIALAYRGITFWFPLGIGFIAFRILSAQSDRR